MPGIFINYRRDDAPGVAGRLYDHLARSFSRGQIFIDVDAIKPGLDFVKQLDAQVSQCDVLLAIIGPHWLNSADDKGKRRLDGDRDYVRIEIAAALKRDIPVIPVLIDGAEMPTEADLPEDLASLARRHALELRHTRFASDADAV
ncbi:MAG TPA: toll/interleukin-1 receptor domain-containing protein, partial [Methyloceanibacter sp.]